MQIQIGRVADGALSSRDLHAMHALRHEVFRERLEWEVPGRDGIERDRFDDLDPTYMLVKDGSGRVAGCWRMLPTTGPYMLKDTFPQTLCGQRAPEHPAVWELSRFALSRHQGRANRFSDVAVQMMESATGYALDRGVTQFVTVTTVAIERLLRGLGLKMQRFGLPVQVGIERTVAFSIEVNLNTLLLLRRQTDHGRVQAQEKLAA